LSEKQPEKILLVATHGPEDPERTTFPFVVANAAQVMDVKAVIALQGTAVLLAQREVADHVFACGLPPLKELMDGFFEQGGELLVCAPCLKERQMAGDLLIEGAQIVAAARVVQEALEAKAVFNY
jgi:predicted peroxiredoxin